MAESRRRLTWGEGIAYALCVVILTGAMVWRGCGPSSEGVTTAVPVGVKADSVITDTVKPHKEGSISKKSSSPKGRKGRKKAAKQSSPTQQTPPRNVLDDDDRIN